MATALSDEEMDETTGTKKMAVAQSDEEMDETRGTETEAEDEIPLSAICKKLEEEFATPMKPVPKSAEPDLMKVYLRVRPCSAKEEAKGEDQNCIIIENETTLLTNAPRDSQTFKNSTHGCGKTHHKFCFSKIFDEDTTQQDFFDNTMLSTVKQFVEGENCLVFTYGVTNSGKTYTIQGNSKQAGLLPRALDVIFNSISDRQLTDVNLKPTMFNNVVRLTPAMQEQEKKLKDSVMRMANDEDTDSTAAHDEDGLSTVQESMSEGSVVNEASVSGSSSKSALEEAFAEVEATRQRESAAINVDNQGQIKFSVWVNFVEIYNELVFDLLVPVPINKNRRTVLHLREDKKGVPYVRGLKEICVNNADEAFKVLTIGQRNLQTACTKLNHNSSRSHCIFNIKLLRVVDKDRPNMARISMLSLCDLAGSERYAKAQTFGDRMKEGGNINASLLTLGRCINVLRHNQLGKENMRIVPFRESKLTRMFQSYFFGRGRACMIVNINKNASTFDETLHALKYSAVAKQVVVLTEPVSQPKIRPKKPLNTKDTKKQVKEDLTDLKRQTIGWASPKTMKELLDLEAKGDGCPVPDGDDFDLSEDGNATCDTTATGDNTAATGDNKTQQQALLSIIDELKKELMNEKKKQLIMESRIREEVCNEMAEQLVEIENEYSERLKREQIMQEEKFDKRLELYAQSVKKNRKRKRLVPDEDGGEASGPRVEELERVNTRLEEQVKAYEKEITELKQRLDNAVGHTPEYYQLQEQVRLAESERTELKREAHQLRQEKDYLEQKLNEASTVVDSVEELQQLVEGSQAQLKAAEERLQAKDETIRRLQGLVDAPTTQTGRLHIPVAPHINVESPIPSPPESVTPKANLDFVSTELDNMNLKSGVKSKFFGTPSKWEKTGSCESHHSTAAVYDGENETMHRTDEPNQTLCCIPGTFDFTDEPNVDIVSQIITPNGKLGSFFSPKKWSCRARQSSGIGGSICTRTSSLSEITPLSTPQTSFRVNRAKYINSGRRHRTQHTVDDASPDEQTTNPTNDDISEIVINPVDVSHLQTSSDDHSMSFVDFLPDQSLSHNNRPSSSDFMFDKSNLLKQREMNSPFAKILYDEPALPRRNSKVPAKVAVNTKAVKIRQTKSSLLRMQQSFEKSSNVATKNNMTATERESVNEILVLESFVDHPDTDKKKKKGRRSHVTRKLKWDGRLMKKSRKCSLSTADNERKEPSAKKKGFLSRMLRRK